MLDFNHSNLSSRPLCQALNELIERAEPPSKNTRHYLGASNIGSECLRKIQYDWWVDPVHPARTKDIFARGHFFEEVMRQHLLRVGFKFAPPERLHSRSPMAYFAVMLMASYCRSRGARAAISLLMGMQMPEGEGLEGDRA